MKFVRKIFLLYLLFEFLGGYAGFLSGPSSKAFAQTSQSFTISTVAPPSNAPLLTSGLNCVTGTGGAFSAGQLVVAYTYTGTAASSESKGSADGGATLTTVVTCPASGVLTIPSPPSPPGCPSCVGWRPYAIASSSGTGAQLLQTVAAANCTLAATSGLTACAIGSSFTELSLGAGAALPTNPTLFTPPPAGFSPLSEAGTGIVAHFLSWVTTGTAATCTVAVQTSSDNVTFNTVGTVQTCTSSGSYYVNATTANFVRLNVTAFTATGANTPSLVLTLFETPSAAPTVTVTHCGTTTTCTPNATIANPQIKVVIGTVTLAANTAVVASIPAFSSTTSYSCTATDQTTAQLIKIAPTSTTSVTITDTVGATDVVTYTCIGS